MLAVRNHHLLVGNHWHGLMKNGQWGTDPSRPGWREMLTFNDILVTVEQRIAKFLRDKPAWVPSVNGELPSDSVRQRTQSKVLDYYWRKPLAMNDKMREGLQWAMSSAVVFAHVFWDRTAGPWMRTTVEDYLYGADTIPDPQQKQDYVRQQTNRFFQTFGQEALQQGFYEGRSGDPAVEIAPIHEMAWWPHEIKSWHDVIRWQRTICKPAIQVAELLGMDVEEVREMSSGVRGSIGSGNQRWRELYYYGNQDATGQDDRVLVHLEYLSPSLKYPRGRQAMVIGTRTVWGPTDLDLSRVTIHPLVEKSIRGRATGTCITDQMEPAQRDINTSLSSAADYRNSRVAPMTITFMGNPENVGNKLSTAPGKFYKAIDAQHAPVAFKMPDVSMDYFQTAESDRMWMSRIGGTASIDVGETRDASVRSGRAIMALNSNNDLRLIPFGMAIDKWVEGMGNDVLEYLQRIPTERIAYATGGSGTTEVVKFRGADLCPDYDEPGGPPKQLVNVNTYSVIPRSPQEMGNFVSMGMEMAADGKRLLDPELNKDQILEMLGLGQFRKAFDRNSSDAVNLTQDIDLWEAGLPAPEPEQQDGSAYYLDHILSWMKTDGYKISRWKNPMAAENVMHHLDMHKQNLARKLVEPQYLAIRANVSEWLKNRAEMLNQLIPVLGRDQALGIVELVLPYPLVETAMMAAQANMQAKQTVVQEKAKQEGKKDKSHLQGVKKADQ